MSESVVSISSDLGWFGLRVYSDVTGPAQILRLTFGHDSREEALAAARVGDVDGSHAPEIDQQQLPDIWLESLQAFATGVPTELYSLPIDLSYLTDFGRRVIEACRQVKWGQTISYGQLARQVGSPNASRAVGGIMARNRHPLIVPCHRVLAGSGDLRGFSAPQGLVMKRRLLDAEM